MFCALQIFSTFNCEKFDGDFDGSDRWMRVDLTINCNAPERAGSGLDPRERYGEGKPSPGITMTPIPSGCEFKELRSSRRADVDL